MLLKVTGDRLATYIPIFIHTNTTSDPVNYTYLDTRLLCYLCQYYCKCLALNLRHPSIVVDSWVTDESFYWYTIKLIYNYSQFLNIRYCDTSVSVVNREWLSLEAIMLSSNWLPVTYYKIINCDLLNGLSHHSWSIAYWLFAQGVIDRVTVQEPPGRKSTEQKNH